MKADDNHLIVIDEQGFYRLLRRDSEDVFSEIVAKLRADSKDDAKIKFEEMKLI